MPEKASWGINKQLHSSVGCFRGFIYPHSRACFRIWLINTVPDNQLLACSLTTLEKATQTSSEGSTHRPRYQVPQTHTHGHTGPGVQHMVCNEHCSKAHRVLQKSTRPNQSTAMIYKHYRIWALLPGDKAATRQSEHSAAAENTQMTLGNTHR